MIRKLERKARTYLYSFIVFTALYALTYELLQELPIYSVIALYILYGAASLPLGKMMEAHIDQFFYRIDWDENCIIKEYQIMKRVHQSFGVVLLYFYLQMGLLLIFYPSGAEVMLFGVPLFLPLCGANCYLAILFYRRFIWKGFEVEEET